MTKWVDIPDDSIERELISHLPHTIEFGNHKYLQTVLFVDSFPKENKRNAADSELIAAHQKIIQYNRFQKNVLKYIFIYWMSTTPAVIIGIASIANFFNGTFTSGLIGVILGMNVITVWLVLGIVLSSYGSVLLLSARRRIEKAADKAPESRKAEYAVRAFFMLRGSMNKKETEEIKRKIRNTFPQESNNPWLDKLPAADAQIRKKDNYTAAIILALVVALILKLFLSNF
ncbi:MAG: hypothetical protein JNL57_08770 [Bacteroidetes bacterium]|nr:hypothetical protein [Bacteroidota bacterium]